MHFVKNLVIANKNNKYRPHIIRRHGLAFALMLIIGAQFIYGVQLNASGSVLGYASNITSGALLSYTNSNRTSNGLPALSTNSLLNSAAQSKANHMIANDYWSHVAPDGTTPWFFFGQAGYAYIVAGENLAYGFDTSLGVVNGWMASPSHRDNIMLADYEEIGFGIANGENYQGGQNTVVVAMYGDPVVSVNPPPPAPPPAPAPVSTPSTQGTETAYQPPAPVELTTQEPEVIVLEEETVPPKIDESEPVQPLFFLSSPEEKNLTNANALMDGFAGWPMYLSVFVLGVLTFAYLYRHISTFNAVISKGEHILVAHPLLEASLIFIVLWLLLTATYGKVL